MKNSYYDLTKFYYNRKDLDIDFYEKKFKFVDGYKKDKSTSKLKKILSDYTTFSYLMFKINNKPLTLYPYQDLILNHPAKRIYFEAANQIGKSISLDVKAARNLVKDHGHGHNEAIVSMSLSLSSYQMRRVKGLLNTANFINWKEEKGDTDNMSIVSYDVPGIDSSGKEYVKYTNYLICAPCSEGLLSFDLHEINLDEFEFWKDVDHSHFYNQIAEPRTYHTKGRIWIFSNPNGMDHYGAELTRLINPDGSKKFTVFNFDFLDCPVNSENDLELAKVGKNRSQIESTLLAIRSLSDRNYFTPDEIERSVWQENNPILKMIDKQPFFFMDVGAKHDQSVLVGGYIDYPDGENSLPHIYIPIIHTYPVGYPLTRVVGVSTPEQDTDGWHHEKSVKEYLKEYSVNSILPVFGVDVTGNTGISPLFETVGINAIDVTFSGPSKSGMYQRFKYFMERGLLHRIKNSSWDYQARHLEVKKSARGYLMIHHENENDLDDCMDATAGLISLCDPLGYVKPSFKVIGNESMSQDIKDIEEVVRLRKTGIGVRL